MNQLIFFFCLITSLNIHISRYCPNTDFQYLWGSDPQILLFLAWICIIVYIHYWHLKIKSWQIFNICEAPFLRKLLLYCKLTATERWEYDQLSLGWWQSTRKWLFMIIVPNTTSQSLFSALANNRELCQGSNDFAFVFLFVCLSNCQFVCLETSHKSYCAVFYRAYRRGQ